MKVKFWKKKREATALEERGSPAEKTPQKPVSRQTEVPMEKAMPVNPSDIRQVKYKNSETGPKKTSFAPQSEFQMPEVPSITEELAVVGEVLIEGGAMLEEIADTPFGDRKYKTDGASVPEHIEIPAWAQKDIALESLDIHHLPINWETLGPLGRRVRNLGHVLTNGRYRGMDLTALKPPEGVQAFLPMLASIVANKRNPEILPEFPTQEQIKTAQPWLKNLERFLGRFSEKAAIGLGKYAERNGERILQDIAEKITGFADYIGTIENPKAELLKELTDVYRHLQARQFRQGDWGREEVPIEDKIASFMRDLQWLQRHPEADADPEYWLNNGNFPILIKALKKLNMPMRFDPEMVGIAGAEFMEGVGTFLRRQGVSGIGPAPRPREFDLFDISTWTRGFAEWFQWEKLQTVKEELPSVLSLLYETLPESGPRLKDSIYDIAENICILRKKGHSVGDIAHHMFPGVEIMTVEAGTSPLADEVTFITGLGGGVGFWSGAIIIMLGGSAIWIPIGLVAGALVGGVIGIMRSIRMLEKEADKK
ncbi:hypothetical protein HY090_01780 [Candidatus Kaiserbacteria bacterium]|nr:hypothetical protein [Candidatus Kaiserbacteria bacterium]